VSTPAGAEKAGLRQLEQSKIMVACLEPELDSSAPESTAIPHKSTIREVFEFVIITVIVALFGMTFLVQGMKVPTGSMQNTIEIGDHLLVDKFVPSNSSFLPLIPQRKIDRGDIIVFKYPGNIYDAQQDKDRGITPYTLNYVKRVVGVPGDVIEISGREVNVNGHPADEEIVIADEPCVSAPDSDPCHKGPLKRLEDNRLRRAGAYGVFYEPGPEGSSESYPIFQNEGDGKKITVPEDSYFVMGDNRDNSEDSRYWGFVRGDLIVGRAMLVYWSYDESTTSSGNLLVDLFVNSRWRRSGTMVK
jgi:signal peptidase I